ncbi:protein Mis18-beta [Sceloporus undulatus]|uniref:protein Mis18-beta n=1 Tax=Sceloporus undulatus TaxID=8520 RepID=UPI001C4BB576|nr:protein Mis18-beta [Sceloporus undulatus]
MREEKATSHTWGRAMRFERLAENEMAVRRQLQLLFQEPQEGGAILVERKGPREGRCLRAQPDRRVEEEGPPQRVPGARGLRAEDCAVYQCRHCRAVLGDSLHLCAQEEKLRLLVCFKVTNDVVVEKDLMVCVEGDLTGCTYNLLHCRSCKRCVGFRLYCSQSLAHLRGFFCLFKDNIICYILKTKTTVEASKVICPQISLKDHVQKLKESLVVVHMRIELLMEKLEGLNQQKAVAEKQGSHAKRHGQTPRCKRKKSNN